MKNLYPERKPLRLIVALAGIVASTLAQAQFDGISCGELSNGFGPYDYRSPSERQNLPIVEKHHFTSQVEALTKSVTGSVAGDIDYTLRAFPNHLRALDAMARLALREHTPKPKGANYTVTCYFERALRFKPHDGLVYMAYGHFLAQAGHTEQAIAMMKRAVELEPYNASANYNLGVVYLKEKDYEQANKYAQVAYSRGYPLPALRKKLEELGKWQEASAANAVEEKSPASVAASPDAVPVQDGKSTAQ
ncbi:tetratricopeptide repeat protein [Noviherbaspirillum galbum]|uniref:Tetratricopeptide repeat protein n=1 Tax=Noviherbaspirillum galbum TaxID=2709383 RepID=A0A6B3ST30_9BURK|nr:tetratricopeptide repeat protein [Noviherbaspirillum galbum]NEX64130.1 tetratricopeptide repeat protein [Noviherbaspirillum galbum]